MNLITKLQNFPKKQTLLKTQRWMRKKNSFQVFKPKTSFLWIKVYQQKLDFYTMNNK